MVKTILAIIGGIYLVLTALLVILIVFKPYGVDVVKVIPAAFDKNAKSTYDHPYLTTQQELFLESAGINPKDIPTQITPQQQQCGISILGEKRANEIASGSTPTMSELLKLKACL